MKNIIIAIDGPAGAGKSTIARGVARRLGYTYIDTGAMYRSVALWALRLGVDPSDAFHLEQLAKEAQIEFEGDRISLNGEDVTDFIRDPQVGRAASQAATVPGVRRAMLEAQRRIGASGPAVMEGRDVGTVIFPDARIKVFLDAQPEERARRRAAQTGEAVSAAAKEMEERDRRDRTRAEAPLIQAPDAEYIDSSALTPDEVEEAILRLVRQRVSN